MEIRGMEKQSVGFTGQQKNRLVNGGFAIRYDMYLPEMEKHFLEEGDQKTADALNGFGEFLEFEKIHSFKKKIDVWFEQDVATGKSYILQKFCSETVEDEEKKREQWFLNVCEQLKKMGYNKREKEIKIIFTFSPEAANKKITETRDELLHVMDEKIKLIEKRIQENI